MRISTSVVVCFFVLLVAFANADSTPTDDEIQAFHSWADAFGKYYTDGEFQAAFANWQANVEKVAAINGAINQVNVLMTVGSSQAATSRVLSSVNEAVTVTYPSADVQTASLNSFSDLTYEEFASMFTGADSAFAPTAAAAAALSTGAIVGIAVGGAAALALAAGVTVAVVKRRQSTEPETSGNNEVNMKRKSRGIDIFKFRSNKAHQSITARGQPING
ncbi:hypothetical protein SAMD00019534_037290 [Acytostelium subglobosum LB1]|uniref:hypothetical protein n=1 Tax=Acytostelium subglobosum LB1 TaxID=1410327 RepID=UPI000644BCD1|nr:hypothetical protein SAMD00019534_037290 [Acytostelium subglobosum LB1]GAM20554.1 hypothetical protein SAMD00019534_037290 [Acytostelium subglobosum LB1]|eukprot:XP_012760075.1 hypothetical protein SAMD00019534_037290 [Acytostelium subglobosum LB1]